MKANYYQQNVQRRARWLVPLIFTLAVLFGISINVNATPGGGGNPPWNLTGNDLCYTGPDADSVRIGISQTQGNQWHVLFQFLPDGSVLEREAAYFTAGMAGSALYFGYYGQVASDAGLYVSYVGNQTWYDNIDLNDVSTIITSGQRQYNEYWIFTPPAVFDLNFLGDHTLSGDVGVFCSGSGALQLSGSDSSTYAKYVGAGPNDIISTDEWPVEYQLYKNGSPEGLAKTGDGDTLNWSTVAGAPDSYYVIADRDNTCGSVAMTDTLTVNDQARVKNTTTGLCYLTIQEGIDDIVTLDGHTLICLKDEEYRENVLINKELTLTADPDLVHFQLDITGGIEIAANNVTVQDFDGVLDTVSPQNDYAIQVGAFNNFFLDSLWLVVGRQEGVRISGSGKGTISNSFLGPQMYGISISGSPTDTIFIMKNTIEGNSDPASTGIVGSTSAGLVVDGCVFNDVTYGIYGASSNVLVQNSDFRNIVDVTGIGILVNGGTGSWLVKDNNFGTVTTTAIKQQMTTFTIDARSNWYGDPTGPTTDDGKNPCGLGSAIVGAEYVNYSPWWFEEAMTTKNGIPPVTLSDITDMSTITKTPLIVSYTAAYVDYLEDFNTTVFADARISSTLDFPAGSQVISVTYNAGSNLLGAPYALPNNDTVYLSDILGSSAPLAGHDNLTDAWELTFAGFDVPWTSTITVDAVSYIDNKSNCNNPLGTDSFVVTFDNSAMVINKTDVEVCTGVDSLKFSVDITYPVILNVDSRIKADALITSLEEIPENTLIYWGYNAPATNLFLVGADTDSIYLSDIVGLGQLPLQGNAGTDTWNFIIPSAAALIPVHHLTIQAIAVLGTDEYIHAEDTVALTVHPLPTATIASADNITHICEGASANLKIDLTGTAPWTIIYTDGTTPDTVTTSTNPYLFSKVHYENKTWEVTSVTDAFCSNTGTDTVRVYVGTITFVGQPIPAEPCEGSHVFVPITVENFEDVGALSLTLKYDTAVLDYFYYTTKFADIYPSWPFKLDGDSAGVIKMAGFAGEAFMVPDNDTIYMIEFIYKGGTTAMTWDTVNPASCEYFSFSTLERFCDFPNKFYYRDMNPSMAGFIRPKVDFYDTLTSCSGTTVEIKMNFTGEPPFQIWFTDGTSTWSVSGITNYNHTLYVSPESTDFDTVIYTPTGVADANGCAFWAEDLTGQSVVYVNPLPVIDTIVSTMITCNGADDGSIDIDPSPTLGPTPWTFAWSNSASTEDISGLAPGKYTVTMTDDNGCFITASDSITEPDVLYADTAHVDVTCNGGSDGTITISGPKGGYGNYEVSIDNTNWFVVSDVTPYVFDTLSAGSYTVVIRDADHVACTITLGTIKVWQPDVLDADNTSEMITCNGADDGYITVTNITGGHGAYDLTIDGVTWVVVDGPTVIFDSLAPGTYYLSIRDKDYQNCVIDLDTIEITEPDALDGIATGTDVTCYDAGDGKIDFTNIKGGYGTYEFSIDNQLTWDNDSSFAELSPGTYQVWIRDAAHTNCTYQVMPDVVIEQPNVLDADVTFTDITCNGADDGSITISNPSGGHTSYEFSIDGTNYSTSGDFTSLEPGTYVCYVRDADYTDCYIKVDTVVLEDPVAIVISGTVKYLNVGNTPLDNVIVKLVSGTTELADTTGVAGTYSFATVCPDNYYIEVSRANEITPDPVNATDAFLVQYFSNPAGFSTLGPIQMARFGAGDVLLNNRLQTNDASRIQQYFLTSHTTTWCTPPLSQWGCRPIWSFYTDSLVYANPGTALLSVIKPAIAVSHAGGSQTVNIFGVLTGDFDTSWVGYAKNSYDKLRLELVNTTSIEPGAEFELPIRATSNLEVGAISMILDFPAEKLELVDAYITGNQDRKVGFNLTGNELRLSFVSLTPLLVNTGEGLVTLKLRIIAPFAQNETAELVLTGSHLNELANGTGKVIPGVVLTTDRIASKSVGITEPGMAALGFGNYPNPFSESTTFVITLPVQGNASIEVFDMLGKRVGSFLNQNMPAGTHKVTVNNNFAPGVYTATLNFTSEGKVLQRTIKIIRNQ